MTPDYIKNFRAMLNKFLSIRDHLLEELKQIEVEERNICKQSEQSINLISTSLKELKELVQLSGFDSRGDEILFFKEIKPSVYSKLIYYFEVCNIELRRPPGGNFIQERYFQKEFKKLESFFSENQEFYRYYRGNMSFLDDKIFVRKRFDLRLYADPFIYDADPDFSTTHDYKVSRILANELLSTYLNAKLDALNRRSYHRKDSLKQGSCSWTESKIALVELIYALQAGGCINNGTGDIKDIASLFESMFNIDLGDFYRTFLEIKTRQNPTKLLDNMRMALIKKIEEQDG
jgi:hypothetical protein